MLDFKLIDLINLNYLHNFINLSIKMTILTVTLNLLLLEDKRLRILFICYI